MPPPPPIREGETIAQYHIVEKLGGGGMGVVYKARHLTLGRFVALKVLPPHLVADEAAERRLLHEAQAASALDHPNICTIHEIGEHEGRLFIAMPCYSGETLKRKIERGPLLVEDAVDFARQMAEGLARAHDVGITHRDVKPANIMVTEYGHLKLLDFGIAKAAGQADLTQTGETLGTAAYMSPEQVRGGAVDQRSDLWALGVVLYEMTTGERPFQAAYAQALIYQILHEEPRPARALRPEIPERLAGIVEKALAKELSDRYQHAADVLDALKALDQGPATEASEPPARSGHQRGPWAYAVLAALLALAALLTVYLWRAAGPGETRGAAGMQPPPGVGVASVAVLPFENLSGDPAQGPLADGLSEDLLQTLARSPDLQVVGRTSSFVFRDTNALADSIGRALGVAYLVQGSVRGDGDRVRVSAQLVDAETGFEAWSTTYEQAADAVLDVPYQIARAIARRLSLATVVARAEPGTSDPEAYAFVQQAETVRRLGLSTRTATGEEAEALYARALHRDDAYAAAWSGLAWARYLRGPDTNEEWTEVRVAAARALSLDPGDAEAHHLLGEVARYRDHDEDAALAHFERAVETDPSDAYLRATLAELLVGQHRWDEALRAADRAVQLGPLDALVLNIAGIVYYRAGHYPRAALTFESTLALAPTFSYAIQMLSALYVSQGRLDDALGLVERGLASHPREPAMRRAAAYIYASAGRRAEAERMLVGSRSAYPRAVVEAALGDSDAAFGALEQAIADDEYALHELSGGPPDPRLRALFDDPRWLPFVARVRSDEWRDGG
ncbi:protein kinase domain-containing protein [Rubrivirga sp. IMCC45206]|uniref:protein kinase domain-containing protein n=1 Tax=Rubrivirga sp. IMCC45206 TaxID=3391614 RepID=UPI00398FFF5A